MQVKSIEKCTEAQTIEQTLSAVKEGEKFFSSSSLLPIYSVLRVHRTFDKRMCSNGFFSVNGSSKGEKTSKEKENVKDTQEHCSVTLFVVEE